MYWLSYDAINIVTDIESKPCDKKKRSLEVDNDDLTAILRISQANLQNMNSSRDASAALLLSLQDEKVDIVVIQ